MALTRATQTLVLYKPQTKFAIAIVYAGNRYATAADTLVYVGTLEEFLIENPDYTYIGA